jgi:hypothetical protein
MIYDSNDTRSSDDLPTDDDDYNHMHQDTTSSGDDRTKTDNTSTTEA